MADRSRTGSCNLGAILHCMKKLLPQLDDEFLDCMPRVLQVASEDLLTRDEWSGMFTTSHA